MTYSNCTPNGLMPYISQRERLEFLFPNSGKTFLDFPFPSRATTATSAEWVKEHLIFLVELKSLYFNR